MTEQDPALFFSGFQDKFSVYVFLLSTYFRYIYINLQREQVFLKQQYCRNQGFSLFFCLLMEGCESAFVQLIWIRGMHKNLRIRTVLLLSTYSC